MYNDDLEKIKELKDVISTLGNNKENTRSDVAHLRDTFLCAEREYAKELLKIKSIRNLISEINQQPSEVLFEIAQNIVDEVEMGQITYEQMEETEQELFIILAAIQDKILSKNLTLLPEINNQKDNSEEIELILTQEGETYRRSR